MTNETKDQWAKAGERLKFERLAHIVREVDRNFQTCLERRLSPYDVNFGFWAYLRVLWDHEGLSQKELSDLVGLTGPTTHSVVKRMEEAGLIELRPIVEGKPRRAVYLSQKGRDLREALEPLAVDVNTIAATNLSPQEQEQLRHLLLKVNTNLLGDPITK